MSNNYFWRAQIFGGLMGPYCIFFHNNGWVDIVGKPYKMILHRK